jgi:hypothetical protein
MACWIGSAPAKKLEPDINLRLGCSTQLYEHEVHLPMIIWEILNIPALIGGAFGATIFGWLGAYVGVRSKNFATRQDVQFLRSDLQAYAEVTKAVDQTLSRSDVLWRGELTFRQQQLAELYGPIYGYIKSQGEIYRLWMGREMDEKNLEVKKLFSSHNKEIRELILAKAHLIEGRNMPDSFVRFVTSTLIFDIYATDVEGHVPQHLRNDSRTAYPDDFNEHVIMVTEALKARIDTLNRHVARPLMRTVPH